jgi:hypothetical protein
MKGVFERVGVHTFQEILREEMKEGESRNKKD